MNVYCLLVWIDAVPGDWIMDPLQRSCREFLLVVCRLVLNLWSSNFHCFVGFIDLVLFKTFHVGIRPSSSGQYAGVLVRGFETWTVFPVQGKGSSGLDWNNYPVDQSHSLLSISRCLTISFQQDLWPQPRFRQSEGDLTTSSLQHNPFRLRIPTVSQLLYQCQHIGPLTHDQLLMAEAFCWEAASTVARVQGPWRWISDTRCFTPELCWFWVLCFSMVHSRSFMLVSLTYLFGSCSTVGLWGTLFSMETWYTWCTLECFVLLRFLMETPNQRRWWKLWVMKDSSKTSLFSYSRRCPPGQGLHLMHTPGSWHPRDTESPYRSWYHDNLMILHKSRQSQMLPRLGRPNRIYRNEMRQL